MTKRQGKPYFMISVVAERYNILQAAMASSERAASPATAVSAERPTSMALVYVWILLFGFVGTQLAWTLRPFFGDPDAPFALFREISGTFYTDILQTIGNVFG